jgi:type IV secretion system protein VirB11
MRVKELKDVELNRSLSEISEAVNSDTRNSRILQKLFSEFGEITSLFLSEASNQPEDLVLDLDGTVRVKRGAGHFERFMDLPESQARRIVDTVAAMSDEVITREKPALETDLVLGPYRYRFTAAVPPLAERVVFAIRFAARRLYRLEDYATAGMADPRWTAAIRAALERRENILIAGGAGSGKTTFANACLAHIAEHCPARVVMIEDTRELQFPPAMGVSLCATAALTMRDLPALCVAPGAGPDRGRRGAGRGSLRADEGLEHRASRRSRHRSRQQRQGGALPPRGIDFGSDASALARADRTHHRLDSFSGRVRLKPAGQGSGSAADR